MAVQARVVSYGAEQQQPIISGGVGQLSQLAPWIRWTRTQHVAVLSVLLVHYLCCTMHRVHYAGDVFQANDGSHRRCSSSPGSFPFQDAYLC